MIFLQLEKLEKHDIYINLDLLEPAHTYVQTQSDCTVYDETLVWFMKCYHRAAGSIARDSEPPMINSAAAGY